MAPINPITSAYTPANIGNDNESNVKANSPPATQDRERRTEEPELRVSASTLSDESGDRRHQEEGSQSGHSDQTELNRGCQKLVVEDVERVAREVRPTSTAEQGRLLQELLDQRIVADPIGHRRVAGAGLEEGCEGAD